MRDNMKRYAFKLRFDICAGYVLLCAALIIGGQLRSQAVIQNFKVNGGLEVQLAMASHMRQVPGAYSLTTYRSALAAPDDFVFNKTTDIPADATFENEMGWAAILSVIIPNGMRGMANIAHYVGWWQFGLDLLDIVLVFGVGWGILGPVCGGLSSLFYATHLPTVSMVAFVSYYTWALPLCAISMFFWTVLYRPEWNRLSGRKGALLFLAYGAFMGCAAFIRLSFLPIPWVIAPLVIVRERSVKRTALFLLCMFLGQGFMLLPQMALTKMRHHEFALTTRGVWLGISQGLGAYPNPFGIVDSRDETLVKWSAANGGPNLKDLTFPINAGALSQKLTEPHFAPLRGDGRCEFINTDIADGVATFNGKDSRILLPLDISKLNGFTIALEARPTPDQQGSAAVFDTGFDGRNGIAFLRDNDTAGQFRLLEPYYGSKPIPLPPDKWTSLVVTIDLRKRQAVYYRDGKGFAMPHWEDTYSVPSGRVSLGALASGQDGYFKGEMRDIRVWPSALHPDTELISEYDAFHRNMAKKFFAERPDIFIRNFETNIFHGLLNAQPGFLWGAHTQTPWPFFLHTPKFWQNNSALSFWYPPALAILLVGLLLLAPGRLAVYLCAALHGYYLLGFLSLYFPPFIFHTLIYNITFTVTLAVMAVFLLHLSLRGIAACARTSGSFPGIAAARLMPVGPFEYRLGPRTTAKCLLAVILLACLYGCLHFWAVRTGEEHFRARIAKAAPHAERSLPGFGNGFEDGAQGWLGYHQVVSTPDAAHTGNHALELRPPNEGASVSTYSINLYQHPELAGRHVEFSCWARGGETSSGTARLAMAWNTQLLTHFAPPRVVQTSSTVSGQWKRLALDAQLPLNLRTASLMLEAPSPSDGPIYFDDCALRLLPIHATGANGGAK